MFSIFLGLVPTQFLKYLARAFGFRFEGEGDNNTERGAEDRRGG